MSLSVATWNVNSLRQRLDQVLRWTREAQPDVLCLQETKTVDAQFPIEELKGAGYEHILFTGQKSYNGVAMLSRYPIEDPQKGFEDGGEPDPQKRIIAGTVKGVRIVGLYVPNGSEVNSDKFKYKLRWLKRLRKMIDQRCADAEEVLICGDMNIAPDDPDVWDPFRCEGQLLFTPIERKALQKLLDFGLTDAFRHKNPFAVEFSWWDYRGMGFQRNQGVRIDHIFVTEGLLAQCEKVEIHRDVRGWEQPSDHVPVMAHFDR